MVWLAVTRPAIPPLDRLGDHDLDEAGVVVVGLVAVDVDLQPVVLGQREREAHRLDAVLAGELVVRDRADDVRAVLHRPAHQCRAAVVSRRSPAAGRRRSGGRGARRTPRAARAGRARAWSSRVAHVDVAADVLGRRSPAASAAPRGPGCCTSSFESVRTRSAQTAMPSNSEPDTLGRGCPTVSTASRWMCGSTRGGVTSRPSRSISCVESVGSVPVAPAPTAPRALTRPPSTAMSVTSSAPSSRALRSSRSMRAVFPSGGAITRSATC